jgi:preprotein translocase subunit SecD
MQTRRLWISLIGIVVVSVALLANELRLGHEPALGLDLQGGVSVILEPTEPVEAAELDTLAGIVRDAVDSLGIAEPDVRVEGETIAVDLPGVKDQQRALELTQVTGEVTFHPLITCSATPFPPESAATTTTAPPTSVPAPSTAPSSTPSTTRPPRRTTTTVASTTSAPPPGFRAPATTVPTTPASTTATTPGSTTPATPPASTTPASTTPASVPGSTVPGSTVPGSDGANAPDYPIERSDGTLVVGNRDGGECIVGPPGSGGQAFSRRGASAVVQGGGWAVEASLADADTWNALAAQCYQAIQNVCPAFGVDQNGTPRGAIAIVLDGEVQSSPIVEAPSFDQQVTISGSFEEREARDLASVLNRGAYPFDVQPATVQTVSPSLGSDSLRATLLAGAIGIVLVMLFMFVYYRSLAFVMLAGLLLSGVIMYGVITFLSEQRNLALTLSGAAGIIVSIGVTVDSYVVFFERLKDEVRHGRTLRNSAQRGFDAAWRTTVNANVTALIGALVLFWLSVGSVRGFAFFLAVSTVVDLIVTWFFTRPAVILLARTRGYGSRVLGVDTRGAGRDVAGEPA